MADSPAVPALRADPTTEDGSDADRVRLVEGRWQDQDNVYTTIERFIEGNIRMLSGRHWDVWSEVVQGFVDPTRYMNEEELRWRQRPVMDFLRYWYMVTLSKVTENQPIIGFLPANGDEKSAALAEVMDPIFKTLADETEMSDRRIQIAGWCLVAGEGYYISRPDYRTGETRPRIGPAVVPYQASEADEAIDVVIEEAPYSEEGDPLVAIDGMDEMTGEPIVTATGDAFLEAKGCLRVDVASPLEIRAQWGSHIPWNEKQWMIHRWFLSPDDVEETYGIRVEADTKSTAGFTPGTLERMLFGTGHFGAAQGARGSQHSNTDDKLVNEFVCGYTMWEKPSPTFPDGRLTVVAGNKVLHDGPRPFKTECAGPIRRVQFIGIPGRPIASTPLEMMVPLQRRYNRIEAQVAEHTNLCTNPILLLHQDAGLDADAIEARPGLKLPHSAPAGMKAAEWLSPPALGIDVWKHKNDVRDHLFTIGSITGNESGIPGSDSSGELIQQLRYNADRPLSPLTRSMEQGEAGVAEDWMAILPTIWDAETVIHYAGEDNIVRTATVMPDMWDGKASARPVMESAAPESREKRSERMQALYELGAFGLPGTPESMNRLLELSRFPELTRASKPGGIHRVMAEVNLGKLLRGEVALELPLLPMYDFATHLTVVDRFCSGPDYLKLDVGVQEQVMTYREMVLAAQKVQLAQAMMTQGAANTMAQATGALPAPSAPPSEPGRTEGAMPNGSRRDGNADNGNAIPGA